MIKYKSLMLFLIIGNFTFGQANFELNDASKNFDVKINVEACDKEECKGKATIELFDKKTFKKFQTLTSDDLNFYLNENQKPTANVIQLYNEQSPLIFDDFNFDGYEDLAIRNGNESGYGGPSYDVYVFNITKKQFVLSEELTGLAHDNLGMFNTDSERKRLITYAKSGCCWHITTEYSVLPQRGLFKVYELEEDATGGETVKVTKKEFIDDKWITNVKTYPINEYYKEN
ncbi:FG-GAP repeat protein [Chryseobacterium taichungense]|uniref:FG-GAP repeat protein n=1 Tax=Chryseobacterium taichungense TaxID=295069 RepID=UPI0028B00FE0|nr:FG-GAP repeat protein [Chryseobacterium taichungense]